MKRLYEDLFTDYNRLILPVANNKTKVTVTLGLKLGQILDLNLKQQILSTNVWVEQTWHDYKLVWNPEQYEGIDMIHVPAENIWIPDIVLFNNADGNYELTIVAKARLYSNGTVVWKPPTMFRSTCEIDVEQFPLDIQTCFLRFSSWTYAGDELELRHVGNKRKVDIGIDLSQFYKNVEWDIIDVPAYYNEFYYECCNEPFPDITFKIAIRRKMLFYLVNLLLPVALMTFMTVSVFYLPSASNEKVTLSISILTSLIVFFLLMLEIIPASSLAVPLFGKYLLFTLVLVSFSASISVYVLNLYHRSPAVHAMSPRVRKIFLEILPRLLRLDRPDPRERSSLNRFRKKKIAQQLLSANNKVYDLGQPMAASLNLIETLHRSYDFKPEDDTLGSKNTTEDEEGRYFRRYVDNYIERLKRNYDNKRLFNSSTTNINNKNNSIMMMGNCFQNKPPGSGNENNQQTNMNSYFNTCTNKSSSTRHLAASCCGGLTNFDFTESSAELKCPLVSNQQEINNHQKVSTCLNCNTPTQGEAYHNQSTICFKQKVDTNCNCEHCNNQYQKQHIKQKLHLHHQDGMLNDDTLDMTFDYDDQENNNNNNGFSARCLSEQQKKQQLDDLPSPPPPPKPLTHMSDSLKNKSGRLSSCSKNILYSSKESCFDATKGSLENNKSQINHNIVDDDDHGHSVAEHGINVAANHDDVDDDDDDDDDDAIDHGKLVSKLINSINFINNASDEMDTSSLTNGDDDDDCTQQANSNQQQYSNLNNNHNKGHSSNSSEWTSTTNNQQHLQHQSNGSRIIGPSTYSKSIDNNSCQLRQRINLAEQESIEKIETTNKQCTCKPLMQATKSNEDYNYNNYNQQQQQQQQHSSNTKSNANLDQQQQKQSPLIFQQDPLLISQKPSDLLLSLRLPYDQMPPHVRAAIRSILFIADTIKNEDDENSAIEDWETMSMVVDRLFLWIFSLLCTFGSIIILASAPSLYDQRISIDDKLRIDIPPSNCSASIVH